MSECVVYFSSLIIIRRTSSVLCGEFVCSRSSACGSSFDASICIFKDCSSFCLCCSANSRWRSSCIETNGDVKLPSDCVRLDSLGNIFIGGKTTYELAKFSQQHSITKISSLCPNLMWNMGLCLRKLLTLMSNCLQCSLFQSRPVSIMNVVQMINFHTNNCN